MLKLENVSFSYNVLPVLKNINFTVDEGEHISIIGESGCGKSTLLQLIYGLHHTDGKIYWKNKELLGPKFNIVPGEPFIKYLAQDFNLMPPLSVEDNIGKFLSNMYPIKKKKRIKQLLEIVEMEEFAKTKASQLSGGQQQRVALARALANEPQLLLLDEPFSHIDHFRKNKLRRQLFSYLKAQNITCITATHDSVDALSFASQTIVLKNGKIHSKKTPQELYNNPPNKYVASLFGDVNEIAVSTLYPSQKSRKKVLLYPHEIKISKKKTEVSGKVIQTYFKGKSYVLEVELNKKIIFIEHPESIKVDSKINIQFPDEIIAQRLSD